jgi:2'-hydroxyisoflavone reductase
MKRVLIIGGTVFVGKALVERLLREQCQITLLHRNPGNPWQLPDLLADRNDPHQVKSAVANKRFDLVFDIAYDWQRGTTGEQVMSTAKCFVDCERYVFMSSIAALESGQALADDHPVAAESIDTYVRNKAQAELGLAALDLPFTILRPPFVYGPGNPFYRETFFWDRMLDARPILLPDDGERKMQFIHVDDLADLCWRGATSETTVNKAINAANPETHTQQQWLDLLAEVANKPYQVARFPREQLQQQGGQVMQPPFYFGQYLDLPPISMAISRAFTTGWQPRSLRQGFQESFRHYAAQPAVAYDYEWEEQLLMRFR